MSKDVGIGSLAAMRQALARMLRGSAGTSHNGLRDVWGTLGYPQSVSITQFWTMYLRGGVAARIVRSHPSATWREQPLIRDEAGSTDEDPEDEEFSSFVESVNTLLREMKILSVIERADRLSRIGRFGVLLMGFADGRTLSDPLEPGQHKLMYLQPYGEPQVSVLRLDDDPRSDRYGMPLMYQISPSSSAAVGGMASSSAHLPAFQVHHSRVIHIAEHLDSDNVYGQPVLQSVFNHLLDLEKVLGSSAETFWLNARGGLAMSVDPDAELTPEARSALREQADEYENQLRRILMMQGVSTTTLTTNVADPSPNTERLLDVIAGTTGIPKRILIGSERGELASSQDENNWGQRIDERQQLWATPWVLRPFIQLMIDTGNVVEPQGEWWIEWPVSTSLTPERQAEIGVKISQSLAAYANSPMAQIIVPHSEFRHEVLGLDASTSYDEGTPTLPPFVEDEEALAEFERIMGRAPSAGELTTDPAATAQTTEAAPPPASPEEETPADQAMNGAQIASLRTIVESVGMGVLPVETAVRLILVGFPTVSEEMARAILAPMEGLDLGPEDAVQDKDPLSQPPAEPSDEGENPDEDEDDPAPRANLLSQGQERMLQLVGAAQARALRANAAPRSLYVSRAVLNGEEILAHYRDQGMVHLMPADQLHVTVLYSRQPVDWATMPPMYGTASESPELTVPSSGQRVHDSFGGAQVLRFRDHVIEWRHEDLVMFGASHDFPEYSPHVTLSYAEDNPDIESVLPWTGPIVLGPEQWEEIDEDWRESITEE